MRIVYPFDLIIAAIRIATNRTSSPTATMAAVSVNNNSAAIASGLSRKRGRPPSRGATSCSPSPIIILRVIIGLGTVVCLLVTFVFNSDNNNHMSHYSEQYAPLHHRDSQMALKKMKKPTLTTTTTTTRGKANVLTAGVIGKESVSEDDESEEESEEEDQEEESVDDVAIELASSDGGTSGDMDSEDNDNEEEEGEEEEANDEETEGGEEDEDEKRSEDDEEDDEEEEESEEEQEEQIKEFPLMTATVSADTLLENSRSLNAKSPQPSHIFPATLNVLRHGIPLNQAFIWPNRQLDTDTIKTNGKKCSCENPKAELKCCLRQYRTAYKMTFPGIIGVDKFYKKQNGKAKSVDYPLDGNYFEAVPWKDYRDVIVLRNIYTTLVKGYLSHKTSSKECKKKKGLWKSQMRHKKSANPTEVKWEPTYELNPPRKDRTLCEYVAQESTEVGMRAYIDWVFNSQYFVHLSHYAMSLGLPEVRARTMVVCREDLDENADTKDGVAKKNFIMRRILDFMYNNHASKHGSSVYGYWTKLNAKLGMVKGVITKKEDKKNMQKDLELVDIIKQVDTRYYNNDIEWLDSIIPCKME